MICIVNSTTSFMAGCIVFSILGHISHILGVDVQFGSAVWICSLDHEFGSVVLDLHFGSVVFICNWIRSLDL